MLKVLGTAIFVFALSVSALTAGAIPSNTINGNYIEARTADVYTGPCFANAEAGLVGKLAVFGWKVNTGSWQGVDLNGLSVVGVVKATNTLGDVHASAYPVKATLIVDSRANAEQRLALQSFARRMGGDLLNDIVKVDYAPIELTVQDGNIHSAAATLTAGSLAKIQTRAINESDHICANEELWYPPLTKVAHAMPAFALEHSFQGDALGETWRSPFKRSGFVGIFSVPTE
jgi:hypothetical protein